MQQVEQQVGSVNSATNRAAYCRLIPQVEQGQVLYFFEAKQKINCRVTSIYTSPFKGTNGRLLFMGQVRKPPRMGTELYWAPTQPERGVYLPIGIDTWDQPVSFRLNAMFRNVLVTGKTSAGKSHVCIVMAEELIKLRVPHLIFDTQNEFTGLIEKHPDRIALTTNFNEILDAIRQRKTIIVQLMGTPVYEKAIIIHQLVTKLQQTKERSYKRTPTLYPPLLITLDEAELFAPSNYSAIPHKACRYTLENLVKRGVKFGLGTILLSQRPPMLDFDIRSQCNSAIIFLLDDVGSLKMVRTLGYISRFDTDIVRQLHQGECLATGAIVPNPVKIKVRDITVKRAKNVDFEDLLYPEGRPWS